MFLTNTVDSIELYFIGLLSCVLKYISNPFEVFCNSVSNFFSLIIFQPKNNGISRVYLYFVSSGPEISIGIQLYSALDIQLSIVFFHISLYIDTNLLSSDDIVLLVNCVTRIASCGLLVSLFSNSSILPIYLSFLYSFCIYFVISFKNVFAYFVLSVLIYVI